MPPPFAMVLVNFAILLIILAKAAWPGIKKATADRSDNLAKALNEGKRLRAEAQAKLDEYSAKLASMNAEIEKMTSSIRAEAEAEQKRLIAEAEQRAERMRTEAQQQIDAEIRRVRGVLEREVAMVAVATAEKILRENTTEADQRAFADRFVATLAAASKQPPNPAA
jgi:F-type H+-transporting ATPase subunit b